MPRKRWRAYNGDMGHVPLQADSVSAVTHSFSGIVVGSKRKSEDYSESWPELASSSVNNVPKATHSNKELTKTEQFIQTHFSESQTIKVGNIASAESSLEFPPLSSNIFRVRSKANPYPQNENSQATGVSTHRAIKRGKHKRNSVIHLDIRTAIEASLVKKVKPPKHAVRRPDRVICGNPLDSSNPARKKGKVRPHRRKQLTTLKKLIIKERAQVKSVFKSQNAHLENDIAPTKSEDVSNEEKGTRDKTESEIASNVAISENFSKFDDSNIGFRIANDGSETEKSEDSLVKEMIHSRKFPLYCANTHSKELDKTVLEFVQMIRRFQDRAFAESEVKARARRRYVIGLHECHRHLVADHIKLLIIPFNIEHAQVLWSAVENLKVEAAKREVPVIFASRCQSLSYSLFKKNRTCAVGIINHTGAEELYSKLMVLFEAEKIKYEELVHTAKGQLRLLEEKQERKSKVEQLADNILETLKIKDGCEEGTASDDSSQNT